MKSKIQNHAQRVTSPKPVPPKAGSKIKIVFIGAGNMAEAMIRGILKAEIYRPADILVTDIHNQRLEFFKRELGINGLNDNRAAAATAELIVLAIKPQQAAEVLAELDGRLAGNPLIISIVTGYSTEKIGAGLGPGMRVIRVVPNTPALVGAGASVYCLGKGTTGADAQCAENILKSSGMIVRLDESLMNAVTAFSGTGPAYVFYLVEAILKAGREMGLPDEAARRLMIATFAGAARMLSETGLAPEELRRRVTSKGGTTAAAVEIMNRNGVPETIVTAVKAAHKRAGELSA